MMGAVGNARTVGQAGRAQAPDRAPTPGHPPAGWVVGRDGLEMKSKKYAS